MSEIICPHCKNPIYDADALFCHFCGESLGKTSSGGLGLMRHWKLVTSLIIVAMIVSFLMLNF